MENTTKQAEEQQLDQRTIKLTNRAIDRFEKMMHDFMSVESNMRTVEQELAAAADECDELTDGGGEPDSYNPLSSKLMMLFVREFHRETMNIIREEFKEILERMEMKQQLAFVEETMFFFLGKSSELLSQEISRRIERSQG